MNNLLVIKGCWGIILLVWVGFGIYEIYLRNTQKIDKVRVAKFNFYGGLYLTAIPTWIFYAGKIWYIGYLFRGQIALGTLVTMVGLSLACWSRFVLNGAWSMHMTIREDFKLVTECPYSVIRHPIYCGQLIMCLGTSIATSNVGVFFFFFCGTLIHHCVRAIREEKFLNDVTEGEYQHYFRNKGRFIPKLIFTPSELPEHFFRLFSKYAKSRSMQP